MDIYRKVIGLDHIKEQHDELQRVKEENEKAGVILKQKNVDIQTIDGYKKLEEELQKYGLSKESPRKLVTVLLKLINVGIKIITNLSRVSMPLSGAALLILLIHTELK
jgi:hypothetical protein